MNESFRKIKNENTGKYRSGIIQEAHPCAKTNGGKTGQQQGNASLPLRIRRALKMEKKKVNQ